MKVLIDTHFIIWSLYEPDKMPRGAIEIMDIAENEICYSITSLWEIEVKHLKNPKNMEHSSMEIYKACRVNGFKCVPLLPSHISKLPEVRSDIHKDPFDRMLICQALSENYIFITHDRKLSCYDLPYIRIF